MSTRPQRHAPEDPRKELIRLVELDYERTADFITGITGTTGTIRGWAVTIWLAIVGIAVDRSQWHVAVLATAVAFAFFLIDGYHSWLYGEALAHASELERLSARYYDSLGRDAEDPEAQLDLQVELEAYRLGMYRNFKRFRIANLRYLRPSVLFRVFYPTLIVVPVFLAAILLALGRDEPRCLIVRNGGTEAIQCSETVIIDLRASPSPVLPSASPRSSTLSPTPSSTPSTGASPS